MTAPKHLRPVLLICALFVLIALAGLIFFRSSRPLRPVLTADEITAEVARFELPWYISEDDTTSSGEDHFLYSLRSQEGTYQPGGTNWLAASFSTFIRDNQSGLFATLLSESIPGYTEEDYSFAWEDWKTQIILTTALYGGMEDEEELYRTVSAQAIPEEGDAFHWGGQLSGAYCTVDWSRQDLHTGLKNPDRYIMRIRLYQSESLYQKLDKEDKGTV